MPLPPPNIKGERALELFTDRHEAIKDFMDQLHQPQARILYFHGDGGNGKSLLLRYLQRNCCKLLAPEDWEHCKNLEGQAFMDNALQAQDATHVPCVRHDFGTQPSFEGDPKGNFDGIMMLRRKLIQEGFKFPFFTYAFLVYLHRTGQMHRAENQSLFPEKEWGLFSNIIGLIPEFCAAVPGLGLVKSLFGCFEKYAGERVRLYLARKKLNAELARHIVAMDAESELVDALPWILAEDLNTALAEADTQRLVLLFDTHDAFWGAMERLGSEADILYQDAWVRTFLTCLDAASGIVAVVAGRDPMHWDMPGAWTGGNALDRHPVDVFALPDARDYLDKAGVTDQVMREACLRAARYELKDETFGAHPLFLNLCVDALQQAESRGETLTPGDFIDSPDLDEQRHAIVRLLLKYVDRDTAPAIKALSACRGFDYAVYEHLGNALRFQTSKARFDLLTGLSFSRWAQWGDEPETIWFRFHDLLRRMLAREDQAVRAHRVLSAYYESLLSSGDPRVLTEYIFHLHHIDAEASLDIWEQAFQQSMSHGRHAICQALNGLRPDLEASPWRHSTMAISAGLFLRNLARHDDAEAEYRQAVSLADRALENDPDHFAAAGNRATALQMLADSLAERARYGEARQTYAHAMEAFEHMLDIRPGHAAALNNLGDALRGLADVLAVLARHDEAESALARAVDIFEQALELQPDDPGLSNNLGLTLHSLADGLIRRARPNEAEAAYLQAVRAFDRALELAPDMVQAHNNKGNTLHVLGDSLALTSGPDAAHSAYLLAVQAFDRALELAPEYVSVHSHMGIALCKLADLLSSDKDHPRAVAAYARALEAFDRALESAPDDIGVHTNRGNALSRLADSLASQNRHAEAEDICALAVEALDRALTLAPDHIGALRNKGLALLGWVHMTARDDPEEAETRYREAMALFQRILDIAPQDVMAQRILETHRRRSQSPD